MQCKNKLKNMERINNIINNETIGQTMVNLFDRWQDESEYEDVNDYGKAIVESINKQYPTYNVKFVSATKRPFGVKVKIGYAKVHFFLKMKNGGFVLCAKYI